MCMSRTFVKNNLNLSLYGQMLWCLFCQWTNVVVFVLSTLIQFHYMSKEWPGYSLKFHFLCPTEEIKAKQVCGNN